MFLEKMSKIEGGTKTIHIFDNNWGLFQKDVDLADHILEVMDKFGVRFLQKYDLAFSD